jgi:hypothetical protein
MAIARFFLAFIISFATPTCSFRAELPASAESLLVHRLNAQKLLSVHEVRNRIVNEFEYLGVFATFEVDSNFETWYHPEVILRKRRSDAEWSQADLFHSRQRLADLFALPDLEFQKALTPW